MYAATELMYRYTHANTHTHTTHTYSSGSFESMRADDVGQRLRPFVQYSESLDSTNDKDSAFRCDAYVPTEEDFVFVFNELRSCAINNKSDGHVGLAPIVA